MALGVQLEETYSSQPITFPVKRMTITLYKLNMQRYSACEPTRSSSETILCAGLIILYQNIDYHAFTIAAAANWIKFALNIPIINVTIMQLLFSKHHNDLTVFEKPLYQNCYLNTCGKNISDDDVSTISTRFFERQLTVSPR